MNKYLSSQALSSVATVHATPVQKWFLTKHASWSASVEARLAGNPWYRVTKILMFVSKRPYILKVVVCCVVLRRRVTGPF